MKTPPKRLALVFVLGLSFTAAGVLTAAVCVHARHSHHHTARESVSDSSARGVNGYYTAPLAPSNILVIPPPGGSADTTAATTSAQGSIPSNAPANPAKTESGPVVFWPQSAGGNGHSYQAVAAPDGINWADAQAWAVAHGGYLATLSSAAENNFVFALIDDPKFWFNYIGNSSGPWLGGAKSKDWSDPAAGWQSLNGEGAIAYTNWAPGEPDDCVRDGQQQDRLCFYAWESDHRQPTLDDEAGALALHGFVVEYDFEAFAISGLKPSGLGSAHGGAQAAESVAHAASPSASTAPIAPVAPVSVTSDLKIISAVFGGHHGEADVTALVAQKVQPGADVLFASPKWLGVDPAPYWKKNIEITYEFRGHAETYSAPEGGAISYDILVANAGAAPATTAAATSDEPKIIAAYFGTGPSFADVTARVAELIKTPSAEFQATPADLQADPSVGLIKEFMIVYEYAGQRRTFTTSEGGAFSRDLLIANAAPRAASQLASN